MMKKILVKDVSRANDRALAVACFILSCVTIFLSVYVIVSDSGLAGIDFSCFWGAGTMALDGDASSAYDWEQLHRQIVLRMQPMNRIPYPYDQVQVPFFYPPVFFFVLVPLALLPYPIAFGLWSAIKISCWFLVIYAIRPHATALLLALATPLVFYDFLAGQSGLLAASLLGGVLLTLDRRPLFSGFLLALLIFKPQYGIVMPFVLVATKRWSVIITTVSVMLALILLTGVTFGWNTFRAFGEAATFATTQFHLTGALPWYKLQSVYGLFRLVGLDYEWAMTFHIVIASATIIWVLMIWRRNVSFAVKAASLLATTPLISPYFAIYDLPILVLALVFLMNTKDDHIPPLSDRWSLRVGISAMVILGYAFQFLLVPVGPFMCATSIVIIWMWSQQSQRSELTLSEQSREMCERG